MVVSRYQLLLFVRRQQGHRPEPLDRVREKRLQQGDKVGMPSFNGRGVKQLAVVFPVQPQVIRSLSDVQVDIVLGGVRQIRECLHLQTGYLDLAAEARIHVEDDRNERKPARITSNANSADHLRERISLICERVKERLLDRRGVIQKNRVAVHLATKRKQVCAVAILGFLPKGLPGGVAAGHDSSLAW